MSRDCQDSYLARPVMTSCVPAPHTKSSALNIFCTLFGFSRDPEDPTIETHIAKLTILAASYVLYGGVGYTGIVCDRSSHLSHSVPAKSSSSPSADLYVQSLCL